MASLVGAQAETGKPSRGSTFHLGTSDGKVVDASLRSRVIINEINDAAFALTRKRTVQEAEDGNTPDRLLIFKCTGRSSSKINRA